MSLLGGDVLPVAGGAHLRVLLEQDGCVEPRPVRVEVPSSHGRVALKAIALGVARHARLEALARGSAVPSDEETTGIVVPGLEGTSGRETGARVAGRTEAARRMAIAAGGLAGVGGSGVAREKPRGMVSRGPTGVGPMAFQESARTWHPTQLACPVRASAAWRARNPSAWDGGARRTITAPALRPGPAGGNFAATAGLPR